MTLKIDGKKMASEIEATLKKRVKTLSRPPSLAVILVGDDAPSVIYVNNKKKAAERVGITTTVFQLSPNMTQDALTGFIAELNQNSAIDGIIVQLPLPRHFNENTVLNAITPTKDVDGLTTFNMGALFLGKHLIAPCTPLACLYLLKQVKKDLAGLQAVVVGRSRLVGRPLSQLLLQQNMTVTTAHSHSMDLAHICQQADVIISATGQPALITGEMIKKDAIVIDVGIHRGDNGKICGDVDFDTVNGKAAALTPVPGGVGPMTVAMLLQNTLQAYLRTHQGEGVC